MNLHDFTRALRVIDSLVEISEHSTIPFAILVRPSHPRYRAALIARANAIRPIGIDLIVIKEVEVNETEVPIVASVAVSKPKAKSLKSRLRKWLR